MNTRAKILEDISCERDRQIKLWGSEDDLFAKHGFNIKQYLWHKYTILGEEVGEIARAILEYDYKNAKGLREELIQTAAVCVAIAEMLND